MIENNIEVDVKNKVHRKWYDTDTAGEESWNDRSICESHHKEERGCE